MCAKLVVQLNYSHDFKEGYQGPCHNKRTLLKATPINDNPIF